MSKGILIQPTGYEGQLINVLSEPLTEGQGDYNRRVWESIPGSGIGTLPNYIISQYGEVYAKFGESEVLTPLNNQEMGRYPAVQLSLNPVAANLPSLSAVHSLVAYRPDFKIRKCLLTYNGPLEAWVFNGKLEVDHINKNTRDSSFYNLQWVTSSENRDRKKNPLKIERTKRTSLAEGEVCMRDVDTSFRYNY